MSEIRQFVVTRAQKTGQKGQNTKFNKNDTYAGKTPVSAARKAFNDLCKMKKIKGQCAMNVTVKEIRATPSGSPSMRDGKYVSGDDYKAYKYRLKRKKDPKVVMRNGVAVKYRFSTKAKSLSKTGANNKKIKF